MEENTTVTTIDYLESPNEKRQAYLTNTDVFDGGNLIFQTTRNSEWMVSVPNENRLGGPYEWLTYVGWDNLIWLVKVHCRYFNSEDYISSWFEFKKPDDSENHDGDEMLFKGWDGTSWRITINKTLPRYPKQPTFNLTKV